MSHDHLLPGPTRAELVAAALAAVLASVALTYPLAFQLGTIGRIDSGDGQFAIWNVAWVARTLVIDPRHVFDANIFYPHPNALAYSEANLGAGALAVPAYWLSGSALVAHNTVVVLSFAISAFGMYLLARRLTGDRWGAAVAAIGFAFCPYLFAHLPHIQLLMAGGLPFVLLAAHALADRPHWRRGVWLGLALGLQALSCAYYGIFGGYCVGLLILYFAATRRLWRNHAYWIGAAAGVAVAIAVVAPFFVPFLHARGEGFARPLAEAAEYSAGWRAYLASAAIAHRWMLPWLGRPADVLFPGFVLLALLPVALRLGVRGRRRELTLAYALLGLLAWWLSLGPAGGLYAALYHIVPVMSFLRAPARAGILVAMALAVLAAIAVAEWRTRVTRRQAMWTGAILIVLAVADHLFVPLRWPVVGPPPDAHRMLARLPPGPVAEFPFYAERLRLHDHARYMYLSTFHWQPLVNGYSDHMPGAFRDRLPALHQFPGDPAWHVLDDLGVRYLVVHLPHFGPLGRQAIIDRLEGLARTGRVRIHTRAQDVWLSEVLPLKTGSRRVRRGGRRVRQRRTARRA